MPLLRPFCAALWLIALSGCRRPTPDTESPVEEEPEVCETAPLPPQQLRLLTRREYARTIALLFRTDEDCARRSFRKSGHEHAWDTVHVAGAFNDWAPTLADGGLELVYNPAEDVYEAEVALDEGTWLYNFVLNEETWIIDPDNPETVTDDDGEHSVLQVDCDWLVSPAELAALDVTAALPLETRPDGFPFDNNAASGLITANHLAAYLEAAAALGDLAAANPYRLTGCDEDDYDDGCTYDFIADFGQRAFRRPLDDDELLRFYRLMKGAESLEAGAALAVQAMLASPSFLYRAEIGEPTEDGLYKLTAYETASALSYFLTGSAPDEALFAAAASGALDEPAGLEAEARRLLSSDEARANLADFAEQWLGVEDLENTDRNAALYPDFDADLAESMKAEVRALLPYVVFDGDGTLGALLTGPTLYPDARLAALYGLDAEGDAAGPVQAPDGQRAGVLGLAAVLTANAWSDQSSPVRRGVFVRERLLCEHLPVPPPEAGRVPDADPDATTRERFEAHTSDPACASCHQSIDPIGFGFERYDAIGAWRETENGLPIDPSGDMVDVEGIGAGSSAPFDTLEGLGQILAQSDAANRCFATQMSRFALGWSPEEDEDCAVAEVSAAFADAGGDVVELLLAIVTSPAFRLREPAP